MEKGQFVGEHGCKTDNKWRLNIPVAIYNVLERTLKYDREIAVYQEIKGNRIVCYTPHLYHQKSKSLLSKERDDKERKDFFRRWYRAEVDKTHRIHLHPCFRKIIKKHSIELLVTGNGDVFEIGLMKHDK